MCGPENTNRPRGGALAALSPPPQPSSLLRSLQGDLAFHTPGNPSSTSATHARLTPGDACSRSALSDLCVVIHSSGDLTANAADCGLFRQFAIPVKATPHGGSGDDSYYELVLETPLSLAVGSDGIIGRRVSLCSGSLLRPDNVVAEGIVGFNYSWPAPAL